MPAASGTPRSASAAARDGSRSIRRSTARPWPAAGPRASCLAPQHLAELVGQVLHFIVTKAGVRHRDRLGPLVRAARHEEPALAVGALIDPQVTKGPLAQEDQRQQPPVARTPRIRTVHAADHVQQRLIVDEGLALLAGLRSGGPPERQQPVGPAPLIPRLHAHVHAREGRRVGEILLHHSRDEWCARGDRFACDCTQTAETTELEVTAGHEDYPSRAAMFDALLHTLRSTNPWVLAVELSLVWIASYMVLRFLDRTRGAGSFRGTLIVVVALVLLVRPLASLGDELARLRLIVDALLAALLISMLVVFGPELRQGLVRLGESLLPSRTRVRTDAESIASAVRTLSRAHIGAIIVIERSDSLGDLVRSGVQLDARLEPRLIESLFWPNSPLHDLAVVVHGNRIVAASVELPLAGGEVDATAHGARHRAAVGVTLDTDAVVVVVSEETGLIRLAERGRLGDPIDRERVGEALTRRLGGASRAQRRKEAA
ncbi:MAG: hypothetical protein FJ252_02010 [Phycisphaerae bacterium]|nr:hypothetical protein [Phycisphaerae bacterium]